MPLPPQQSHTHPEHSPDRTVVHSSSRPPLSPQPTSDPPPHRTISNAIVDDWMATHPVFAAKARGIRLRSLRFTASWFSVTMGTGIVNTLLFDLPFSGPHPVFRAIGSAFLVLDMILFSAFTVLTVTRYFLYPRIFWAMIKHETHSLFLGTIPMGLVTIVSGIASTGHEYGLNTLDAALVLYWITVGLSILTSFGVPYYIFTAHKNRAETLPATLLLPIVPLVTQASVGSTFCKLLLLQSRTDYCLVVFVASYLQAGIGLFLAGSIIVMYLQRLILHHLPPREVIVSSFLPVGPIGQGGFALIELGRVACDLFPRISSASHAPELALLGPSMLGSAVIIGLLLWGLGIWFVFFAVVSIATQFRRDSSNVQEDRLAFFNMGWWAFTFPLGSLTLLTFSLAEVFDSSFFRVVSAIFTFSVLALWIVVAVPTAIGFVRGTLFAAPCLQSLPKEYVQRMRGEVAEAEAMAAEEARAMGTSEVKEGPEGTSKGQRGRSASLRR